MARPVIDKLVAWLNSPQESRQKAGVAQIVERVLKANNPPDVVKEYVSALLQGTGCDSPCVVEGCIDGLYTLIQQNKADGKEIASSLLSVIPTATPRTIPYVVAGTVDIAFLNHSRSTTKQHHSDVTSPLTRVLLALSTSTPSTQALSIRSTIRALRNASADSNTLYAHLHELLLHCLPMFDELIVKQSHNTPSSAHSSGPSSSLTILALRSLLSLCRSSSRLRTPVTMYILSVLPLVPTAPGCQSDSHIFSFVIEVFNDLIEEIIPSIGRDDVNSDVSGDIRRKLARSCGDRMMLLLLDVCANASSSQLDGSVSPLAVLECLHSLLEYHPTSLLPSQVALLLTNCLPTLQTDRETELLLTLLSRASPSHRRGSRLALNDPYLLPSLVHALVAQSRRVKEASAKIVKERMDTPLSTEEQTTVFRSKMLHVDSGRAPLPHPRAWALVLIRNAMFDTMEAIRPSTEIVVEVEGEGEGEGEGSDCAGVDDVTDEVVERLESMPKASPTERADCVDPIVVATLSASLLHQSPSTRYQAVSRLVRLVRKHVRLTSYRLQSLRLIHSLALADLHTMRQPILGASLAPLFLFAVRDEPCPPVLKHMLFAIPELAVDGGPTIGVVLRTIKSLSEVEALRPIATRMLGRLWMIEPQTFVQLKGTLDQIDVMSSREQRLSRACVILDVCKHKPDRGTQLLHIVSKSITSDPDKTVQSIYFRCLNELMAADTLDFHTAWGSISKKVEVDKLDSLVEFALHQLMLSA